MIPVPRDSRVPRARRRRRAHVESRREHGRPELPKDWPADTDRPARQIARPLGITPKTAGNHIERIYAKVGVSSRAEAALFAMQHGLVVDAQP